MSGGIAYVLDDDGSFASRCNMAMVELEPMPDEEDINAKVFHHARDLEAHGMVDIMSDLSRFDGHRLHHLISRHARLTGSRVAATILDNWKTWYPKFRKVDAGRVSPGAQRTQGRGDRGGIERQVGKITGFLEYEREDRDYEPVAERIHHWREFVLPLPEKDYVTQAARCMNCGVPYCMAPARWRPARRAARLTTRFRIGTTSSIPATGTRRRATCIRPIISRKSPAGSARRRAKRPARSTSTTIRSPSNRSNARSPTAPSPRG